MRLLYLSKKRQQYLVFGVMYLVFGVWCFDLKTSKAIPYFDISTSGGFNIENSKFDGLAKCPNSVTPAKAGVQELLK
jgi:hypothetical protein